MWLCLIFAEAGQEEPLPWFWILHAWARLTFASKFYSIFNFKNKNNLLKIFFLIILNNIFYLKCLKIYFLLKCDKFSQSFFASVRESALDLTDLVFQDAFKSSFFVAIFLRRFRLHRGWPKRGEQVAMPVRLQSRRIPTLGQQMVNGRTEAQVSQLCSSLAGHWTEQVRPEETPLCSSTWRQTRGPAAWAQGTKWHWLFRHWPASGRVTRNPQCRQFHRRTVQLLHRPFRPQRVPARSIQSSMLLQQWLLVYPCWDVIRLPHLQSFLSKHNPVSRDLQLRCPDPSRTWWSLPWKPSGSVYGGQQSLVDPERWPIFWNREWSWRRLLQGSLEPVDWKHQLRVWSRLLGQLDRISQKPRSHSRNWTWWLWSGFLLAQVWPVLLRYEVRWSAWLARERRQAS